MTVNENAVINCTNPGFRSKRAKKISIKVNLIKFANGKTVGDKVRDSKKKPG